MEYLYRTVWATITAAENGLMTFRVVRVDTRINPTVIAVGDEPIITGHCAYVPVNDVGRTMPEFDFYSAKEGSVELEVNLDVVFLCNDLGTELVYLNWTTVSEYRACQKKIETRLGKKRESTNKPNATLPKVDSHIYRLYHDNQRFTGTRVQISADLYRYNRESQRDGWPEDCVWEVHTGKKFARCAAPVHPGPNHILEPRKSAQRSMTTA